MCEGPCAVCAGVVLQMIKMNQMPPGASEEKSDQLLEHLLHGLACATFAQPREVRGDLLQLIAAVEEYQLPAPDFSTTTQHTMAVLFAPPCFCLTLSLSSQGD